MPGKTSNNRALTREQLAAMFMQAILTNAGSAPTTIDDAKRAARDAFKYADAFLEVKLEPK